MDNESTKEEEIFLSKISKPIEITSLGENTHELKETSNQKEGLGERAIVSYYQSHLAKSWEEKTQVSKRNKVGKVISKTNKL